ncbi:MAG: tripartite tricarboxylate transporter substrate binding protein [Thermodesulfobacteriota bacterium]
MSKLEMSSLSIKHFMVFTLLGIMALASIAGTPTVVKAEYPEKPITLMVGFSAGGGTDVYARSFASFVHEYLDMPMIVVNKPGASGMIAAKAVYDAPADGYTLLLAGGGTLFIKSTIDGDKAPVVPTRELKALGGVGQLVTSLIVPMDSPFKSAKDLVDWAKANPDKRLRYSHSGRGSIHTLAGMVFLKQSGIEAQDVPFKGGSKARNAVAGKQVDFSAIGIQLLAGFETKLRALGVGSNERDLIYKDVPTFGEQGLPLLGITNPEIIWGHKDLPKDVVSKLEMAIKSVASSEGFQKMIRKTGVTGFYFTPDEANEKMAVIDKLTTPLTKEMFHKKQ